MDIYKMPIFDFLRECKEVIAQLEKEKKAREMQRRSNRYGG